VWSILKDNADNWFMESKKPKPVQAPPPSVAPVSVQPKPALKPENKCPYCGKWKGATYPVCAACHLAEKEE
jgi:hypothetical protein